MPPGRRSTAHPSQARSASRNCVSASLTGSPCRAQKKGAATSAPAKDRNERGCSPNLAASRSGYCCSPASPKWNNDVDPHQVDAKSAKQRSPEERPLQCLPRRSGIGPKPQGEDIDADADHDDVEGRTHEPSFL